MSKNGSIMTLVLVFGAVFLALLGSLVGFLLQQAKVIKHKVYYEQALTLAEAGVEYYHWHLAHAPLDWQDGTGGQGPYEHLVYDWSGQALGSFSLQIIGGQAQACDSSTQVIATGRSVKAESSQRTVRVVYGNKPLVNYAFLTNSNAWFGPAEYIKGPLHANGGIRMDGTQNNLFTSAKDTYICGPEHGCANEEKPGIWGAGPGSEQGLWQFPVPAVDFAGIARDFADLKAQAQASGVYLPQLGLGYHLYFRQDNSLDIYRVKKKQSNVWAWDGFDWIRGSQDIDREEFYQTVPLDASCNLIFVEDDIWVQGVVAAQVTIVAASLPDVPATNKTIFIPDNLTYLNDDGSCLLGLIAQKDILVPLYAPDVLNIQGALLAQKGKVMRYYYPSSYAPWHLRKSITVAGAVISNGMWTWTWVSGTTPVSGYVSTYALYDDNLNITPPPFFPTTGRSQALWWEEQ